MSEETIEWHALTPEQRNAVVAEKVMGLRVYKKDTWGRWAIERLDKPGLTEEIPLYTTSLDAAWPIWTKLGDYDIQRKFLCAWVEDDNPERYDWKSCNPYLDFLDVESMQHITPERICLAALRACGYEVRMEP